MILAPAVRHRPRGNPHRTICGLHGGSTRKALTRIEVLIAVGVVAIVLGVLIPGIAIMKEASHKNQCKDRLKQLALGVQQFHDQFRVVPYNHCVKGEGYGAQSHSWSWLCKLLPYLEYEDLFKDAGIPEKSLLEAKDQISRTIPVFLCPSDPKSAKGPCTDAADLGTGHAPNPYVEVGYTNYKGVMGCNWKWGDAEWQNRGPTAYTDPFQRGDGTFYREDFFHQKPFSKFIDGLSQTAIIGEALPDKSKWCAWPYSNTAIGTCAIDPNARQADGYPYDPEVWQNTSGFFSNHSGGLHFAFADGSVRFIKDSINRKVYRAMSTIAGGEIIMLP